MRTLDRRTAPTHLRSIALVLLTVGGAALLAAAEAGRQAASSSSAFEVATIKLNKSGSRARSLGYPPNRFVATNMPLKWLIGNAYGDALPFRQDMIFGGPSWIDSEGYDVEAKASSTGSPDDQSASPDVATRKLMLRKLLVDRFALTLRTETRELPLYALVMAREDRRLGPRLASSAGKDCVTSPPPGGAASTLPLCGPAGPLPWGEAGGHFVTMADIGKTLGQFLDRPVIDQTGLSGRFTFALKFTPPSAVTPAPGVPRDPPPDPDVASIFTAVQEQLGLKLEPQRGPLDVLVIDAAERPTPD